MKTFCALIYRNFKLFFKDKGLFFTSLITPLILLVLYATFLGNVYKDSFMLSIPAEMNIDEKIIGGFVGGQLISSLLAVSCITVAFCSNMLMVQDKANGIQRDFSVSPVKNSYLAWGYYIATFSTTLLINLIALAAGLVYIAAIGWYLTFFDILLIIVDIFLLTMFGTVLSSVINFFLSSQGQISAVGTIVSSCYGFICGAYMPISQFSEGLQKVISLLPCTYATSLIRNHTMRGSFEALQDAGLPEAAVDELKTVVDCKLEFFGTKVSVNAMFAVLSITIILLLFVYIALNHFWGKKAKKA